MFTHFFAGNDLQSSYNACSVAMEFPKSHNLKKNLNISKAELATLVDSIKDFDLDDENLDEGKLEATMVLAKRKALYRSKRICYDHSCRFFLRCPVRSIPPR